MLLTKPSHMGINKKEGIVRINTLITIGSGMVSWRRASLFRVSSAINELHKTEQILTRLKIARRIDIGGLEDLKMKLIYNAVAIAVVLWCILHYPAWHPVFPDL